MSDPAPGDEFHGEPPASLWELFVSSEPQLSDDGSPPAVDRELLLKLVRKELPKEKVRAAYLLIHAFDSWKKAFAEIVIEEFRNKYPPGSSVV